MLYRNFLILIAKKKKLHNHWLGVKALLNVVYDGFLARRGTKSFG
jgi:hypothetical protein